MVAALGGRTAAETGAAWDGGSRWRTQPGRKVSGSDSSFHSPRSAIVRPKRRAMAARVSPGSTVYRPGFGSTTGGATIGAGAGARAGGADAAVGADAAA